MAPVITVKLAVGVLLSYDEFPYLDIAIGRTEIIFNGGNNSFLFSVKPKEQVYITLL